MVPRNSDILIPPLVGAVFLTDWYDTAVRPISHLFVFSHRDAFCCSLVCDPPAKISGKWAYMITFSSSCVCGFWVPSVTDRCTLWMLSLVFVVRNKSVCFFVQVSACFVSCVCLFVQVSACFVSCVCVSLCRCLRVLWLICVSLCRCLRVLCLTCVSFCRCLRVLCLVCMMYMRVTAVSVVNGMVGVLPP